MSLRVLDVGCSDGVTGAWLRARFGDDVLLHGLELNPEAARLARGRGYGQVLEVPAEAAHDNYGDDAFDAVVAFEVIEHVPDPDAFLDALEAVLAPGGRIYLSTPDGTFGAGGNPNHLRVYRALDLADMLRRRGTVEDMEVGRDGIAVASYIPAERRGEIAIFTGPSWMTWAPFDIEHKGLGGSETAAVRLAEALADDGYVVTVYGEVEEGCVSDVVYRPWTSFDPSERRLGVIASRLPQVFERPVNAQFRALWMHDTDCGSALTEQFADRIDRVLCLSGWHARYVAGLYPFVQDKIVQVRNGITTSYFDGDAPAREQRVVYTSSPDRGLDVLLEEWPRIRERVPGAKLAWAYSPVYFRIAESDPVVAAHAQRIRELSEQDGVEPLGSLSQPEVAKLMRSSLVWCAPSWNTPHDMPFHETSCIGAMEAQAAGCHVVASGWGALPETVRVGALLGGPGNSPKWRDALVNEIVRGLVDPATQQHAQEKGPEVAESLGWAEVARQVAALCEGEVLECAPA